MCIRDSVETAKKLNEIFLEIVVAYDFTEEALDVLRQKKNLRVLKLAKIEESLQPYDCLLYTSRCV